MRLILLAFVVIFGSIIGTSAINTVSNLQDAKLQRFCKQVPQGASYDEMCARFR
jgi:hypothetical protein